MLFNTSGNTNTRSKKINYLNYMVYLIFGYLRFGWGKDSFLYPTYLTSHVRLQ